MRSANPLREAITAKRATIYSLGMFGYRKTEVRDLEAGLRAYAQYPSAVYASFVPKGKRKRRAMSEGYNPSLVILDGWKLDLSPDSPMAEDPRMPGMMTSRYGSYDPRYAEEFEAKLDAYLKATGTTPLADYRGTNTYARPEAATS